MKRKSRVVAGVGRKMQPIVASSKMDREAQLVARLRASRNEAELLLCRVKRLFSSVVNKKHGETSNEGMYLMSTFIENLTLSISSISQTIDHMEILSNQLLPPCDCIECLCSRIRGDDRVSSTVNPALKY